jgi:hypothetical protein
MGKEENYMSISEIAIKLKEMAKKLDSGELHADEIVKMTSLTRQLHERMIVLQYKAFEETVSTMDREAAKTSGAAADENKVHEPKGEEPAANETGQDESSGEETKERPDEKKYEHAVKPTEAPGKTESRKTGQKDPTPKEYREAEESTKVNEDRPAFRIGEAMQSQNQISLIDSIDEIKEMEHSLNDAFKAENKGSLSQKMNDQPITDLKSAISINQKFTFINELFEDDADAFNNSVAKLNNCQSYIDADHYIKNSLKDRYDWQMKNPVVKEFDRLVQRRFL